MNWLNNVLCCIFWYQQIHGLNVSKVIEVSRDLDTSSIIILGSLDLDESVALLYLDQDLYIQVIQNQSEAHHQVSEPLDGKQVVVLSFGLVEDSFEVLALSNQHNLIHNTWIIVVHGSIQDAILKASKIFSARKQLSPLSTIFLVEECLHEKCPKNFHQMIGNIKLPPKFRVKRQNCESLEKKLKKNLFQNTSAPVSSHVDKDLEKTVDLEGQTITVSYEHFPPFIDIIEKDKKLLKIGGIIPEIVDHIAHAVNLTIKYVPFKERNIWSRKHPNGTWSGDLADVASGEHDTSVAAYMTAVERLDYGNIFKH